MFLKDPWEIMCSQDGDPLPPSAAGARFTHLVPPSWDQLVVGHDSSVQGSPPQPEAADWYCPWLVRNWATQQEVSSEPSKAST